MHRQYLIFSGFLPLLLNKEMQAVSVSANFGYVLSPMVSVHVFLLTHTISVDQIHVVLLVNDVTDFEVDVTNSSDNKCTLISVIKSSPQHKIQRIRIGNPQKKATTYISRSLCFTSVHCALLCAENR